MLCGLKIFCGIAGQARDELGNRRLCGGDAFALRLEGPASVPGAVADRGNGTYAASYCARLAGRYELSLVDGARAAL